MVVRHRFLLIFIKIPNWGDSFFVYEDIYF